jgi:class 3 adenylate cyclase
MSREPTPAPPPEPDRARQAWLANKRQELLAPASALLDLSEMLFRDAQERGHESFLRDQCQVRDSARRLLAMIAEVLAPGSPAEGDLARRVRHDLRTPLTEMIGLCEIWLEDAGEVLLEGFLGDLNDVHGLARKLLAGLDDILGFGQASSDPEIDLGEAAAGEAGALRALVASLPAVREQPGPASETGAVLVVEDNAINRDVLARRLSRDGHAVTTAENGRRALGILRARAFDLVLLDVIMPELNGLQVLERMKADARLRHVPVIMISAFHELDGVVRCIEMGAEDYLPKPFNPVLLRARIGACLEKKRLRDREVLHQRQIDRERRRADELLHVLLPGKIVAELKKTNAVRPRRHDDVAVLFADVVGFTPFCDRSRPEDVVPHLQALVETWEEVALRHGVEKIKTIGDAVMAAAGLLQPADNPVLSCLRCGLEMIAASRGLPTGWDLRVGVHVGPVVAGVIGRRQYLFDLWGDTVNTAARVERNGVPGSVTLSAAAWRRVAHCCRGESRGAVAVKGKGALEMVRFAGFLNAGVPVGGRGEGA